MVITQALRDEPNIILVGDLNCDLRSIGDGVPAHFEKWFQK